MKEEIKSLFRRVWKSKNDLALVVICFIPQIILMSVAVMIAGKGLSMIGIPVKLVKLLCKILIGISPVVPCLVCWWNREEFEKSHGMNACVLDMLFGVWLATIVVVLFL